MVKSVLWDWSCSTLWLFKVDLLPVCAILISLTLNYSLYQDLIGQNNMHCKIWCSTFALLEKYYSSDTVFHKCTEDLVLILIAP